MGKKDDIQKAGDVLRELFSHLNFEQGKAFVSFFSDWMELVGVDLACHVRPVDIRHKSLLLEVDHPGWMQMFQLKQRRILHRIERKHPSLGITSFHFRLKSISEEEHQQLGSSAISPNASSEGALSHNKSAARTSSISSQTHGLSNPIPLSNPVPQSLGISHVPGSLSPQAREDSIPQTSEGNLPKENARILENARLRIALEKLEKQVRKRSKAKG
jgi:hypothetical protein